MIAVPGLVRLRVEVADRAAVHGVRRLHRVHRLHRLHRLHGLLFGHGCSSYRLSFDELVFAAAFAVRSPASRAAPITPATRARRAPCARATMSVFSSGPVDSVVARVRRAVGIAAAVEDLVHGVPERQHDGAPVVQGVVEREDRRLLTAVLGHRRREGRRDLVDECSSLPELAREVEEDLQLRRDVAEASRRSEGDAVRPLEVLERGFRLVLELGAMTTPVLLEGDRHLGRQFGDVAEPNIGSLLHCAVRDGVGEWVHVAGRAVVDDCDSGHGSTVPRSAGRLGSHECAAPAAFPAALAQGPQSSGRAVS